MTRRDLDFDTAWRTAPQAVRRALGPAYGVPAAGGCPAVAPWFPPLRPVRRAAAAFRASCPS